MELILKPETLLGEIKNKFHSVYPFLKLEFFKQGASPDKMFHRSNMISDENLSIEEVGYPDHSSILKIYSSQTVETLEKHFLDHFGLYVQVFRKSGDSWLETIRSDQWTLHEQNMKGRELSVNFHEDQEEEDIHEQS